MPSTSATLEITAVNSLQHLYLFILIFGDMRADVVCYQKYCQSLIQKCLSNSEMLSIFI